MSLATIQEEIRQLVDALFVLTDAKAWRELRELFIDGPLDVDVTSLAGGAPVKVTADALIAGFARGLHASKTSHHMATNYRTTVDGEHATVTAQGYAWNRVATMPAGEDLWETWGHYELTCQRAEGRWLLASFKYFSKHTRGPDAVRTHTL